MSTISYIDRPTVEVHRPAAPVPPVTPPAAEPAFNWDALDRLLLPLALFLAGPGRRYGTSGRRRRLTGDVARVVAVQWRDASGTWRTDAVATGWIRPEVDA